MRSLEEVLAFQCAPALAGIKPSCLMSCRKSEFFMFDRQIEALNQSLNHKDIYIRPISISADRYLILAYRKKRLGDHLSQKAQAQFLAQMRYPIGDLEQQLTCLEQRLKNSREFPHETGAFLGYPIQDIEGFLQNNGKNYKLSGYWKVYSDEDKALETFERYSRCRNALCKRVSSGKTIAELFCTA